MSTERSSRGEAFERLGQITRQLHEAMGALGVTPQLRQVAHEIPDARDRLAYVGRMTEQAAARVLDLVDGARPACGEVSAQGRELAGALQRMADDPAMDAARARALMRLCAQHAGRTADFAEAQNAVLGDIMMAQDFQDLSGQVIRKVIDIITRTEQQLLELLIDSAPEDVAAAAPAPVEAELAGPQVPDKALQQDEVDDLLASLGF
ncbi:protein phosphatase CheZ [Caldimonas tepidiphila]|uniref:protein phosphatase CheZ n=1 Tax=Caldimonas tepidiphila TaxID=2315841 RepID=UPI000E5BEFD0|nr:protein phosphatase CheZ [Caldimonas tepidiphila]